MAEQKMLIIEDEGLVALALEQCLTSLGYRVVGVAADGEEAIRLISGERPDLILMDIRLKGETDGIDLAYWIRKTFRIPVVFLTAHSDEETLERAKIAEPFGFIIKPFDENVLRSNIEIALYKASMELRIQRSKNKLAAILHSLHEGIILCNNDGVIDYLNSAAAKILGMSLVEAKGKNLSDLVHLSHPETRERIELPLQKVVESRFPYSSVPVIVLADDSEERSAKVSVVPILNELSDVAGVVFTVSDCVPVNAVSTSQGK